jgi:hypothetical protein
VNRIPGDSASCLCNVDTGAPTRQLQAIHNRLSRTLRGRGESRREAPRDYRHSSVEKFSAWKQNRCAAEWIGKRVTSQNRATKLIDFPAFPRTMGFVAAQQFALTLSARGFVFTQSPSHSCRLTLTEQ